MYSLRMYSTEYGVSSYSKVCLSSECDECALDSEHWEMQLAHSDSDVWTVKPDVCH